MQGELVRRHRLRAGLTQQELADRVGLSIRTLRDLEQDRVGRPRAGSLRRLTSALGLSEQDEAELLAGFAGPASGRPARLHVAVLGPLVVHRGDAAVDVSTGMQRSMLALLALHPGTAVTRDDIIDSLWGERPPRSCHALIHTYIGQLRRLLWPVRAGQPPTSSIALVRGGYQLTLNTDQIDLARFDEFATHARRAHEAGDHDTAHTLYRQAMDCWRAPILTDATDRLRRHPAATAATQRRLAATLAYADLAIHLGQHKLASEYLRALAVDEPLHEGLHARLMLALHGHGEQAAALQLFADVRTRLVDELGVEPGPELRAAHLYLLRQSRTRVVTGPPVPAQLPLDVDGFTGREEELAHLDKIAASAGTQHIGVVVSAVWGTAGVGKTALAVHWAHRVRDRFPDGQLYANLRGFDPTGPAMTPGEVIRVFLDALGVPAQRIPSTLDAQIGLYRSLLANKRILVVLDNAHDSDQVRALLPGTPGALAVITSRNQLTSLIVTEGAHPLTLDLLPLPEARQLLANRLGAHRVAAEPDAADEIITRCARLPLALAVVAARAVAERVRRPLAAVADELRDAPHGLDPLDGGDPLTNVRAVFSWSYRFLSAPAARLFRLLGLHPGPDISAAAAASLAGLPADRVRPLLDELTRSHMLTEPTPGRYLFHDLLRAYATEQTHTHHTECRAALHRVLDHYLHTAHAADGLLDPERERLGVLPPRPRVITQDLSGPGEARAWFATEHPVLVAAVQHAATHRFDTHAWQLAWTLATFLDWQGHWHDLATTQVAALTAARRHGDGLGQAHAHRDLARAAARLGHYEDADRHLRRALVLFGELGDNVGKARTHLNLGGIVLDRLGPSQEALEHAERALELFQIADYQPGRAHALNAVGWMHAQLGNHQRALAYCQEALTLHHERGDRGRYVAAIYDSLGYVHHQLGHHEQAVSWYLEAVRLRHDLGEPYYEARSLTHLGDAHVAAGDTGAAHHAWQQALVILDQLDHPDAEQLRAKLRDGAGDHEPWKV